MRKLAARCSIVVFMIPLAIACLPKPTEPDLADQLQTLLDTTVAENDAVRSAAVHADSPTLGLSWEGAAGLADPDNGVAMTPATSSRIASNTKTFVAASILRLAEEGKLDLDDPIADRLPDELLTLLVSDGYDTSAITLRHLLTHTSGLYDHTSGDEYAEEFMADPLHRWTRTEQVTGAVEWGDPLGEPGRFYTYCDTGYVLLGAVIAEASGQPMAEAVRGLVDFDRLELDSTWWETLEPRPEGLPDRAHQFFGDIDTYGFDPSFDLYGGGGLVSTVGDLARFYRALFTGGVFARPETIDLMLSTIDGAEPLPEGGPAGYRMGIWVTDIEGHTAYMHTGFFGTLAIYVPDLDLALAVAVNQNQSGGALRGLARELVRLSAGT